MEKVVEKIVEKLTKKQDFVLYFTKFNVGFISFGKSTTFDIFVYYKKDIFCPITTLTKSKL